MHTRALPARGQAGAGAGAAGSAAQQESQRLGAPEELEVRRH
jgi:hypothetical protein